MSFRTKLDYSDNRQIQQRPETLTTLSGSTVFGIPFNALPIGPDLSTSAITSTAYSVASTFSGNSATTVYNWYTPVMQTAYSGLTAITPTTSANTQYTSGYSGATFTTIDGNTVALSYTGSNYDLTCSDIQSIGGGNYSGTVITTTLDYLSAGTLDFTGRTIWVDVSGITRTQDLILSNTPIIGANWECVDSEGMGAWVPASASTSGIWVVGNGNGSAMLNNGNNTANGNYSVAEGRNNQSLGVESHTEGDSNIASGPQSHAEGNSTQAIGNYSHAQNSNSIASGISSHAEGDTTVAGGDYSHAGGFKSYALADYSFVHGSGSTILNTGIHTIVLGANITGKNPNTTYVEQLNIQTLPIYANNTAATSAGLDVGTVYRTSTGQLMVRY